MEDRGGKPTQEGKKCHVPLRLGRETVNSKERGEHWSAIVEGLGF